MPAPPALAGLAKPAPARCARYALVVKRPLLLLPVSVALLAFSVPSRAQPRVQAALPSLPGAAAAGTAGGLRSGLSVPGSPQQLYEHVRRSVVAVERNGIPLAIGTVLDGDGRILTALSGLGGVESADVRYADGTTVRAKIGQQDRATDLALLVPSSITWTEGLAASEADPVGVPLRAILPARGGARLGPTDAGVKGRVEAHSRDGAPLGSMLDTEVKGPAIVGAPLLDGAGSVVGVLVHACKGAAVAAVPDAAPWVAWAAGPGAAPKPAPAPCTAVVVGAPVSAIRSFLVRVASPAAPQAPWLGIRGETSEEGSVHGVRVVAVAPSSPAQKAGLRPGADVIVAADGRPIDTPETLGSAIAKHAPGDAVKLLVFGDQTFREVVVALREAP